MFLIFCRCLAVEDPIFAPKMTREDHIREHEAVIVLAMYQDMISYVVFY